MTDIAAKQPCFYTPNQIGISAFLFGPLAGCWFLSQNFKIFGEEKKARHTMWAAYGLILLLTLLGLYTHGGVTGTAVGYTVGIYSMASRTQGERVKAAATEGFIRVSNWRVAGMGLLLLALNILVLFAIFFILYIFNIWTPPPK